MLLLYFTSERITSEISVEWIRNAIRSFTGLFKTNYVGVKNKKKRRTVIFLFFFLFFCIRDASSARRGIAFARETISALAGFSRLLTFSSYCCILTAYSGFLHPDLSLLQKRKWPGWKILKRIDDNFSRRIGN